MKHTLVRDDILKKEIKQTNKKSQEADLRKMTEEPNMGAAYRKTQVTQEWKIVFGLREMCHALLG